ncbi:hypothetical protein IAU60_006096 [Kwoniella sp. DSM 27419]
MARHLMDVEDELSRLWGIVGELSDQLSNNRALVTQLKARSENVKGQAAHVGAGFPLRRFNLDISNEEFHSELEAFSSHLVAENQQLQHENKQLNALLKEYEQTLETVMGKFRGVAHSSQQHDLSLHSYYTSLLQQLQTAHSSAQLHDATSLSTLLTRLSTLLRSALRSLGGEETDQDLAEQLPGLIELVNGHAHAARKLEGPMLQSQYPSASPPSPTKSTSSAGRTLPRAPTRPVPFPGFMPGTSGGYSGTEGQADWALEREMEILRLEEENLALREMLSISTETKLPSLPAEDESAEENVVTPSEGAQSRKSSLTVEELEHGAAMEAELVEDYEKVIEMGRRTKLALAPEKRGKQSWQERAGDIATEITGTTGPQGGLGFDTDTPPPESAIVDEPDAEGLDPNGE